MTKFAQKLVSRPQSLMVIAAKGSYSACKDDISQIIATPKMSYKFEPRIKMNPSSLRVDQIDIRQAVELIYRCRTARNIFLVIDSKKIDGYGAYKKWLSSFEWKELVPEGAKLKFKVESVASRLFHETGVREVTEKIIPNTKEVAKGMALESELRVDIDNNLATIMLSLCGAPLYKRGYKSKLAGIATIREDLATCLMAGVPMLRQPAVFNIANPCAGTGTLGIEAYLFHRQIPNFVFDRKIYIEALPLGLEATFTFLKRALLEDVSKQQTSVDALLFNDIDPVAIEGLKANLENLGTALKAKNLTKPKVEIRTDSFEVLKPNQTPTLWLINPPFGHRMGVDEENFAKSLSTWLKKLLAATEVRQAGVILMTDLQKSAFKLEKLDLTDSWQKISHGGLSLWKYVFDSGKDPA